MHIQERRLTPVERAQARHQDIDMKRNVQIRDGSHIIFDANGFSLTAPVTITAIETIVSSSTSSSPPTVTVTVVAQSTQSSSTASAIAFSGSSVAVTTTSVTAGSSSSTSSSTNSITSLSTTSSFSSSSSTPSSSSLSSSSTSTSVPLASASAFSMNDSPGTSSGDTSDKSPSVKPTTSLTSAAIAGIVIGILLVIAAAGLFLVRKQLKENRQRRRNNNSGWEAGLFKKPPLGIGNDSAGSSFGGNGALSGEKPIPPFAAAAAASSFYNPNGNDSARSESPVGVNHPYANANAAGEMSPGVAFARAQAQAMGARPTPPPLSYNSPNTIPRSLTPGGGSAYSPAIIVPPQSNGAIVKCSFIPTLPDELSIVTGEVVRVLAEYDDGWALCQNGRAEQGMVPLECLDRSGTGARPGAGLPGGLDLRDMRRDSSLQAGLGDRRY